MRINIFFSCTLAFYAKSISTFNAMVFFYAKMSGITLVSLSYAPKDNKAFPCPSQKIKYHMINHQRFCCKGKSWKDNDVTINNLV